MARMKMPAAVVASDLRAMASWIWHKCCAAVPSQVTRCTLHHLGSDWSTPATQLQILVPGLGCRLMLQ